MEDEPDSLMRSSTIHDDSDEDDLLQNSVPLDDQLFGVSKKEDESDFKPGLKISNISDDRKRISLRDLLPEFELSKVERLQSELKASEQIRKKVESENLDLQRRIKDLEFELEKQKEYSNTLILKQQDYNENMLKRIQLGESTTEEDKLDSESTEAKQDMYEENMISFSFNQALVKYENAQSLHSPYFDEWDEKIDIIYDVFNRWTIHLNRIIENSRNSSKSLSDLHKIIMEDLTIFDFSTEIVNDLYSFADMLKELSSMQESLYESVRASLLEYINEFNKLLIKKVKDNKKVYNKHFDDYFNLVSKLPNQKKSASLEELNLKIDDSKKDLELLRIQYIDNLNEIIIHTKVDMIDKVCV